MRSDANMKTPLFLAHGVDDSVVRVKFGEMSYEELKKLDVDVEFHKYPGMGHEANPEELKDLGAWIKARIGTDAVPKSET
jgi:predicted esterase